MMAIWFHDFVYNPHRLDNEHQSGLVAHDFLREFPIFSSKVVKLINVTTHNRPPTDRCEEVMLDVDLAILGAPPEKFALYERQIRQEYSWVPEQTYREVRAGVLSGFLTRPNIYNTYEFRVSPYEQQAKVNLENAVRNLEDTTTPLI